VLLEAPTDLVPKDTEGQTYVLVVWQMSALTGIDLTDLKLLP
jgi:hypothetical protein